MKWIKEKMGSWFDIKVRAMLGGDSGDDKEVTILGRIVRWGEKGIEYEADPQHRKKVLEYFGFESNARKLSSNGEKSEKEEEWELEDLEKEEATVYRGLAARLNYMSQDSPDLQFPIKACSQEMAKPKRGSWKRIKNCLLYTSDAADE